MTQDTMDADAIVARIEANVEALYEGEITVEAFRQRQHFAWADAEAADVGGAVASRMRAKARQGRAS